METKTHKIEPEIEEIEEEEDKRAVLSSEEYQLGLIRHDLNDFMDRVSKKIIDLREEIKSIKASLNRGGIKLGGYTLKELMGLKQLGINPKDLLMGGTSLNHGIQTQEEKEDFNSHVSKV
jgi:hypothetical protein